MKLMPFLGIHPLYQHTLHYIHPSPVVDNSVRPNMLIQEVFGRALTRSSSNNPIMISVLFIKSYKKFYLDKVLNTGSLAVDCSSSSSSCTLLNKLEAFKGFQEDLVVVSNIGKGLNFCCCCCCSSLRPVPMGLLTPAVGAAFAVAVVFGLV